MPSWNQLPPTPNQMNAIQSYERSWGVSIQCNTKQDAHDVISLFVKDKGLTFKNGTIVGTTVKYTKIDRSLDILSMASKSFDNYQRELEYDDDLRDLDDKVFGADPYCMFH